MSSTDIKFSSEIFRKDNPMIIASNRVLAIMQSVRLAYKGAAYKAGQVLAQNNVSSLFEDYDDGAASGLDVAKCVLFEDVGLEEFASSGDTQLSRGIFGGVVFEDKLIDLDANAKTDLGAKSFAGADGINLMKF